MVIWVVFPFIICISDSLSFHLHFVLFKLESLKAQDLFCDALGLSNLNYVIAFLTYSEFISVILWWSYLFSLSSYTPFYFKNNSDSSPYLSFFLWRVLSVDALFLFTFIILTPYPIVFLPFFANDFIKTPKKPNLVTDFHRYTQWHERSLFEFSRLVPQL